MFCWKKYTLKCWAVQGVVGEPICRAFDNISSRDELRGMSASASSQPKAMGLPPIVAMGGSAGSEWVEFAPDAPPQGALHPPCATICPETVLRR